MRKPTSGELWHYLLILMVFLIAIFLGGLAQTLMQSWRTEYRSDRDTESTVLLSAAPVPNSTTKPEDQRKLDLQALVGEIDTLNHAGDAKSISTRQARATVLERAIVSMTSQVPVKGTAPDQFAADFQTLEREQKNASNEFYSGLLGSVRQGADVFLDSAYLGLGILVSICGFLGGVLAEVYDWKVNNQSTDRGGTDGALATFICATAAGPIGVFVLANSDPSNWGRCALFAVICGFTWKGILEQARMIGKNISQTPDEQTLKAPEAISKIADSNEKNFADNVDKAVSDMSKIFDLSTGAGGTAEQRLLAKNQSNQIISAIYDQVNKLQSSADLLVTALRGIRDIVVASIPANDLNILEVGIDKIVGLARGTKDNDVKQEGVSCLSQIRDKFGTKLPATKADFISNRINDIGFAAKATASIAKGGSGTTAAKPTGSDGSGSAPHTVANAELSGGTGTDQTAAPFADVQAGQEKAPEGEVEK